MKKLIVFDLDGTLLNTLRDLTNSVNYAMTELSLKSYEDGQVRDMIGNGVSVLMSRAVSDRQDLHAQALELQRSYYKQHTNDFTKPYCGIADMLSKLKLQNFVIAVHTNKDENCAKKLVYRYFKDKVDFVCGTTSDVTKPDAGKIVQLMRALNVSKDCAVYCGDSDVDIQTASNAGIACVSVTWGFRSKEFLLAHGARYFADSPKDVLPLAQTIIKLHM